MTAMADALREYVAVILEQFDEALRDGTGDHETA